MCQMSSADTGFKMDRQMNDGTGISSSDALGLASVWVKAQHLSIGRSDALTIGSSDGCI
jgi:hypothetical protein